jgi:apolipoprotein N-acyltransferase
MNPAIGMIESGPVRHNPAGIGEPALGETALWMAVSVGAFQLAYRVEACSFFIVVYLFGLVQLTQAGTCRRAFYSGLGIGFLIAAGCLGFFWKIFSAGSVALWLVYAFWTGLFTALARLWFIRFPSKRAWVFLPFLWCGLEYFRSELYYLRFSWLTPALAFSPSNVSLLPFKHLGAYGVAFVFMIVACAAAFVWRTSKGGALVLLLTGAIGLRIWAWGIEPRHRQDISNNLSIAGVQLEFPTEKQVCTWLNEALRRHPEAQLLVLSEYTFMTPIPESVFSWCREHQRYLIIGGKDPASLSHFYNTAFVISPAGQVVFRQAKAVPIQFFNDGLPAPDQAPWQSPWGRIGICICYDLSYTRVTDRLARQGAEILVVPTMDVGDWGKRQHELHARIAPVRAAEYGIPIFRLASSGISQAIDSAGQVMGQAPCPGEGAIITASFALHGSGRLPLDRWLAPLSSAATAIVILLFIAQSLASRSRVRPNPPILQKL